MAAACKMSERMRLETLCVQDGTDIAKQWARRAMQLYRQSIDDPTHFASQSDWKPRFEQSIWELAMFIEHETPETPEVIHDN
jgi:hypothetical protein